MEDGTIFAGVAIGFAAAVAAFVQSRWRRPSARTGPFSAPAWAAAEALAKSRGHGEVREEHLFAALLFDATIARKLAAESVNVDAVQAKLDAHLEAVATYRTNETIKVTIVPSLAKRVKGVRDDIDALFDTLRADPTPVIAEALETGRCTPPEPPESGLHDVVHLRLGNQQDRTALVGTLERHFGLSRAAATFVVETAVRDDHAIVGAFLSHESTAMVEGAKTELAKGTSLWISNQSASKASKKVDVKIDKRVELALTLAATLAKEDGYAEVTTSHLLRVLIRRKRIAEVLLVGKADLAAIENAIDADLAAVPKSASHDTPMATDGVQRVVRSAVLAAQTSAAPVDETGLLCALFDDGDMGTQRALQASGLDRGELRAALLRPPTTSGPKDGEKEVVLYNDDVTTMEQVTSLLVDVFGLSKASANELTLEVHFIGESVITTLPDAEANALVETALEWCAQKRVPLRLSAR